MFGKSKFNRRGVYFDHAAATAIDSRVLRAMLPFFSDIYANPSAVYGKGREANDALNDSRRAIAEILHTLPKNIIFTSGGTESNNLAIFGVASGSGDKRKHIVSTLIEHQTALQSIKRLADQGGGYSLLQTDRVGLVKARDVIAAIRPDTILVSVMYANNEIGTVEPIAEIGRAIINYRQKHNTFYPYFHTDACQAAGYLDLDVERLHVDMMTINGSKIYGPKGVGILYARRGIKISPMILGGAQEFGLRAGTENLAGAVGLAKALEIAQTEKDRESSRQRKLASHLWRQLLHRVPDVCLNGPEIGDCRLPNNLNIVFKGAEAETILFYLDEKGIMCSAGSACSAGSSDYSHVLAAIGLSDAQARSSLRFTLGKENSQSEVDYMIKYLPALVEKSRSVVRSSGLNLAGREKI